MIDFPTPCYLHFILLKTGKMNTIFLMKIRFQTGLTKHYFQGAGYLSK